MLRWSDERLLWKGDSWCPQSPQRLATKIFQSNSVTGVHTASVKGGLTGHRLTCLFVCLFVSLLETKIKIYRDHDYPLLVAEITLFGGGVNVDV